MSTLLVESRRGINKVVEKYALAQHTCVPNSVGHNGRGRERHFTTMYMDVGVQCYGGDSDILGEQS